MRILSRRPPLLSRVVGTLRRATIGKHSDFSTKRVKDGLVSVDFPSPIDVMAFGADNLAVDNSRGSMIETAPRTAKLRCDVNFRVAVDCAEFQFHSIYSLDVAPRNGLSLTLATSILYHFLY